MAGPKLGPAIAAHVDPETVEVPVGGYVCSSTAITFDADRPVTTLKVRNTGDRPVQVGSHFHFFEVNRWSHCRSGHGHRQIQGGSAGREARLSLLVKRRRTSRRSLTLSNEGRYGYHLSARICRPLRSDDR
jgi:hypothetical protein